MAEDGREANEDPGLAWRWAFWRVGKVERPAPPHFFGVLFHVEHSGRLGRAGAGGGLVGFEGRKAVSPAPPLLLGVMFHVKHSGGRVGRYRRLPVPIPMRPAGLPGWFRVGVLRGWAGRLLGSVRLGPELTCRVGCVMGLGGSLTASQRLYSVVAP